MLARVAALAAGEPRRGSCAAEVERRRELVAGGCGARPGRTALSRPASARRASRSSGAMAPVVARLGPSDRRVAASTAEPARGLRARRARGRPVAAPAEVPAALESRHEESRRRRLHREVRGFRAPDPAARAHARCTRAARRSRRRSSGACRTSSARASSRGMAAFKQHAAFGFWSERLIRERLGADADERVSEGREARHGRPQDPLASTSCRRMRSDPARGEVRGRAERDGRPAEARHSGSKPPREGAAVPRRRAEEEREGARDFRRGSRRPAARVRRVAGRGEAGGDARAAPRARRSNGSRAAGSATGSTRTAEPMTHRIQETADAVVLAPAAPATASVIWLHGLGADGHDFVPIVPELKLPATPGMRFVFPHAPVRPVTLNMGMRMRAWYDIKTLTAEGRADEAGIRESVARARRAHRGGARARHRLGAHRDRGLLAGRARSRCTRALRHPEPLAGILALSCYLPLQALLAAELSRGQPADADPDVPRPVRPGAAARARRHGLQLAARARATASSGRNTRCSTRSAGPEIQDIAALAARAACPRSRRADGVSFARSSREDCHGLGHSRDHRPARLFWVVGIYNGLVTARNGYKNAFAQIDVQLTRRHDLIPNLVETAKGYLAHERQTLEAVITARNAAVSGPQGRRREPRRPGRGAAARRRRERALRRARPAVRARRGLPGPQGEQEHDAALRGADHDREQGRVRAPGVQRLRDGLQQPPRDVPGQRRRRHVRVPAGAAARDRVAARSAKCRRCSFT